MGMHHKDVSGRSLLPDDLGAEAANAGLIGSSAIGDEPPAYTDFDAVDSVHEIRTVPTFAGAISSPTSSAGAAYTDIDAISVGADARRSEAPAPTASRSGRAALRQVPVRVSAFGQRAMRDRRWLADRPAGRVSGEVPLMSPVGRPSVVPGPAWGHRPNGLPADEALTSPTPSVTHGPSGARAVRVMTPDLSGLHLVSARNVAADCGLEITVTLEDRLDSRPGSVAAQWPEAGGPIRAGGRIHVVVASSPLVAVPDVVGHSIDDARKALHARGLRVIHTHERHSPTMTAAGVVASRPRAGELVSVGSLVRLISDHG